VKPVFSEFSYGFALTHELINRFGVAVAGAPVFPSLIQEGRSGGYDVGIPLEGWTIFLQFKVSQLMKRQTAMHWGEYGHPYFRFPLRPASYSDQHRLLLQLAHESQLAHFVAYVAPAFHEPQELNDLFLRQGVAENSVWIPALTIGEIHDNEEHWIIFDGVTNPARLRSEQRELVSNVKGSTIGTLLTEGPTDTPRVLLDEDFFRFLSSTMMAIGGDQLTPREPSGSIADRLESRGYSSVATCAYLARILFDSELVLAFAGT